ncbi:protein phosphatase 1 regulatory subunit 17 isoform X2 [Ambystoma mexicanum]|uniref:protein phosphatase 1 regulatory subunit 17 isoform X2 n=1 Tax=Ambystoma mexicanum TaxID=8296 RepID=UPI0037E960E7
MIQRFQRNESTMSTECMQQLDTPEDRLDNREQLCNRLDDLTEKLIGSCEIQKKQRTGKAVQVSQTIDQDLQKPRRKDTPAIHISPFISDLSEQLLKRCDVKEKQQRGKMGQALQGNGQEPRKPRRKDTPALNIPPLLQGGKLVRDDRRTIAEDEEKDEEKTHS